MKTFTLLTLLFIFLLAIPAIQAQDLNLTDENSEVIIGNVTNVTIAEEPICEEQLEILLDEYNSLLEDYKAGKNCGNAFYLLESMNKLLGEERDACREEVGGLKVYKVTSYILLGILFITAIVIIYKGMKK